MNKKKKLLLTTFVCLVLLFTVVASGSIIYPRYEDGKFLLVEWVFRDDYSGNIIGNPNFKASFDHVESETFIKKLTKSKETLDYNFTISERIKNESGSFKYDLLIDETITLNYGEGFIIMSLDSYDEHSKLFYEVLKSIHLTLLEDERTEDFPAYDLIKSFEDYKEYYYNTKIDYRFYHDGNYEVHIEDMKMGH